MYKEKEQEALSFMKEFRGINKEKLRAFVDRRKMNALGLMILTFMSAVITAVCAVKGFERTDILAVVTVLLVLLCFVQEIKLRKSYRTMKSFKGTRKKKSEEK